MAAPKWRYRFTRPVHQEKISVPAMLRDWHRAMTLGLELASLEIDGEPVDERTLFLLNLWISANGAWNASKQDYFRAWDRLERVLRTPKSCKQRQRRASDLAGP